MQNKIKNKILDCVVDTAKQFLQNDMSISIYGVKLLPSYILEEHFASIGFSGKEDFLCIISIDTKLLKSIYRIFFPKKLNEDETNEMMRELPKEIINIVAGLSILKFPLGYKELELSVPLDIKRVDIKNSLADKYNISAEILTESGSFYCTIIG